MVLSSMCSVSLPVARLAWLDGTGLRGTQGTGSEEVRLCLMFTFSGGIFLVVVSSAKTGNLVGGGGGGTLGATQSLTANH